MNHRERALKAFKFEKTDRPPCDLLENMFWPELQEYFKKEYGLTDKEKILTLLDVDFRWISVENPYHMRFVLNNKIKSGVIDNDAMGLANGTFSDTVFDRPFKNATVADIEALKLPTAKDIRFPDFEKARNCWPDHALVFMPYNFALFMSACDVFGIEEAMVKMAAEPEIFEALIKKMHESNMDVLREGLKRAKGLCDICWTWDDFATQESLLVSPDLWRRLIKPYIAEEIAIMREYGMFTLYHSCGAIRSVIPDLIEIGVNAVEVFQVTASGMDARSIARDFGGKMVFYGGIDVQHLLRLGSTEDVRSTVRNNVKAFEHCGGYIVTNSHHGISDLKGENIVAMCDEAHNYTKEG